MYRGTHPKQAIPIISSTQAYRMLKIGCPAYLCVVEVAETQEPDTGQIPVVQNS